MQERLLDEWMMKTRRYLQMKMGIFLGMLWKVRKWMRMGKDSIIPSSLFLYSQTIATFFLLIFLLHSIQKESDDLKPIIPCKRSLSPSEALTPAANSKEPKFVRDYSLLLCRDDVLSIVFHYPPNNTKGLFPLRLIVYICSKVAIILWM